MGFNVEINSILRSRESYELAVGGVYGFEKSGSRVFFDNIPIWLTDGKWNALAEISILSQTRRKGKLKGEFRVDYLYSGAEQRVLTDMFIRMYGGLFDPDIYVLSSKAEYDEAVVSGRLQRASLNTDGFIHASPASELNRVANKYYRDVDQALVLVVDKSLVSAPIEWEPATGGLYPHIYGPLNMSAVGEVVPIALNAEGVFNIELSHDR